MKFSKYILFHRMTWTLFKLLVNLWKKIGGVRKERELAYNTQFLKTFKILLTQDYRRKKPLQVKNVNLCIIIKVKLKCYLVLVLPTTITCPVVARFLLRIFFLIHKICMGEVCIIDQLWFICIGRNVRV